jgi:ubiquinone/menaquinone biosynthesis C-methylase UbiE
LYDEGYYRYRESTRDFRIEAGLLYDMLMPRPGSRVLEVGCGGGAFLAFLEARGLRATGVDISRESVSLASRTAAGSRVLEADAAVLPFEDACFDCVVSHHLVEHLADLQEALAEWSRVLISGGIMAICTPNRAYPRPDIFYDPSHVHIYMAEELAREVERAGFHVLRCMTVFPHLLKDRISVALGVPLHGIFARLPYYKDRGRSLLLSARKP